MNEQSLLIGGEWRKPAGSDAVDVINPSTGQRMRSAPLAGPADIDLAVERAATSFRDGVWRDQTWAARADVLTRFAELIRGSVPELSMAVATEAGPTITMSTASHTKLADVIDRFAALGRTFETDEYREDSYVSALIRRQPVGVAAAISPFNGPVFLTLIKVVPALLAGCSVVAKTPPESPAVAGLIGELLRAAGVPDGVVTVVPGGAAAGERLVAHPQVRMVSFTGSSQTGRAIAAACGQQLKRCVLELGGKSAAIVLDDADLDLVTRTMIGAAYNNTGQACNALTRLVVPAALYDTVVDGVCDAARQLRIGDASDEATQIGPIATQRQLDRVNGLVDRAVQDGAKVATGGRRPDGLAQGWFIEPTVLTNVVTA